MRLSVRRAQVAAVLAAVGIVASACAPSSGGGTKAKSDAPVKVAVIYSKTGLLAGYGAQYLQGFKAGLAYATKGTDKAGGHKLDISYVDDGGDPAKAVSAAKQYIGDGSKIIAGTTDSGIATQLAPLAAQNKVLYVCGPAAADTITGVNKYTFRSGRQSYQDVATAGTFVGDPKGKRVLVFAQDSTFGQGNAAAVKQVLGAKGATVSNLLVPSGASDFTPFARRAKQAKPDLVFVAWAGDTTSAMWKALDQQGVLRSTTVVTGLADRASYGAYGTAAGRISFLSHYFPGAVTNPVNKALIAGVEKVGGKPDLFSPDGFVAAQMIVRAVAQGGTDPDKMVSALAGWSFQAPKGRETIRANDHALLQPMFRAKLVRSGATWAPQLVSDVAASDTTPPLTK